VAEQRQLVATMLNDMLGLGPLEPFLKDPTVNDILVNGHASIYVERKGKLQQTPARFKDEAHLRRIIDRIVSRIGRRVDESSPMVDARLEDGSRFNAIIPPLAIDGSSVSIRKFSRDPLELHDLVAFGALTPAIGEVLKGIMPPNRCPLFATACTPATPVGPCMVSTEGSCAAYYKYRV